MQNRSASSPSPSYRLISNKRVNPERDALLQYSDGRAYCGPGSKISGERLKSDDDSFCINQSTSSPRVEDISHPLSTFTHEYAPGAHTTSMRELLPYYLPILSWVHEYCFEFFVGDLIGGVSLATFQIPLAISYSNSLAKVPITCGLYSLGISPLVYMFLGSVPQMITGPEAPISLIVGQAVEPLLHHSKKIKLSPIEYVVTITFLSGFMLLGLGLGRFGFLDNILCDSLLKGFIFGVGIVMIINASIPMLGLEEVLKGVMKDRDSPEIHSPFDKLVFVVNHIHEYHLLTLRVSLFAFATIMIIGRLKSFACNSKRERLKAAVYIPDILIVVVTSTVMCSTYKWNRSGLEVVGKFSEVSTEIPIFNPISWRYLTLMKHLASSGLVCAMLGFFESTTALKSLGSRYNLPISSNRELVALGAINIFVSIFAGLPAFGGYGRSKINAISAKTTISGAIMGFISLGTAKFVLEYLHYIPKCVLSVITATIGILLMSEGPPQLKFHWKSKGYDEVFTFVLTVLTTLFFSMEAGVGAGLIYLFVRVVKNSTESNIQILGRVPGTNQFLNADTDAEFVEGGKLTNDTSRALEKRVSQLNLFTDNIRLLNYQALEEIEGCLIVKIPEPLTFANANDLRARLDRLERYGSTRAHPALKRKRAASMSKYTIFDLEGMSFIDSSAVQILYSVLKGYQSRGMRSFFVRVPKSLSLRERLRNSGVIGILREDLEITKQVPTLPNGPQGTIMGCSDSRFSASDSRDEPFFEHIRTALAVIDNHENESTIEEETV